jgi:hypothetical protein
VAEARSPDHRDVAQEIARDLVRLGSELGSLKGEAYTWLTAPEYGPLRHRIEAAHAAIESAAVEARRRVRLNEERGQ